MFAYYDTLAPWRSRAIAAAFTAAVFTLAFSTASPAAPQPGFPDSLRKYSDNRRVPFRIGTAVTLQGWASRFPVNGYQPGLLSTSERDKAYQALISTQFNQVEPGNELKMMNVWTGGASRVNGRYRAKTNLDDPSGPLLSICRWAESQPHRLTVRGHCMVYYPGYTLPRFPKIQPPLFVKDKDGKTVLNPTYQPSDLRDMLQSYVEQIVDATMAQNALSRARYGYKVVTAWDVTNEVVSENNADIEDPGAGFAYRGDDPWRHNGPRGTSGNAGYDYVSDLYRWASQRMKKNVGSTVGGQKITAADTFLLYYNDYNLEWSAPKTTRVLNLIRRIRQNGGTVDGLGFQAHTDAGKLNAPQFEASIRAAIQAGLRFSITENDISIQRPSKDADASIDDQEAAQGRDYSAVAQLCLKYRTSCDAYQIWGATDDGSWLQNKNATPFTRWIADTRAGATLGKFGYWPKMGQYAPQTQCDPVTGELDPQSGRTISAAFDHLLSTFKAP